jgi:hypothetical protein
VVAIRRQVGVRDGKSDVSSSRRPTLIDALTTDLQDPSPIAKSQFGPPRESASFGIPWKDSDTFVDCVEHAAFLCTLTPQPKAGIRGCRRLCTMKPQDALRAIVPLSIACLIVSAATPAVAQPVKELLDLEKLYTVEGPSWAKLARRLVSTGRAKAMGRPGISRVRILNFETLVNRGRTPRVQGQPYVEVKPIYRRRGSAKVIGGKALHPSRESDHASTWKILYVDADKSTPSPRHIRFHFRVRASAKRTNNQRGAPPILAEEEFVFEIYEDVKNKVLRLVLDPDTFRKHQKQLESNFVPIEKAESGEVEKNGEATKKKATPAADANGLKSKVTLVRYAKISNRKIEIGFRRKWSANGGKVTDGIFRLDIGAMMNSALYFELPTAKGSTKRVQAAYFTGGHRG